MIFQYFLLKGYCSICPKAAHTQPITSCIHMFRQVRRLYIGDALSAIKPVPLEFDLHAGGSSRSPLVFIHGLFGSKSNTRTVARTLAKNMKRDVYCVDLRNFGHSPHDARLDYPALASDVEHFIESEKLDAPILVGHSMGAKAAMAVALRRPELPGMLVSVDNAPVCVPSSDSSFLKYVRQLRQALEVEKFTSIKDVDLCLARVEPSKEIRQFLLTNIDRGSKTDVCRLRIPLDIIGDAIAKGQIALWPFDPSIVRSSTPALFIRGTESRYVPDDVFEDIGKYFPDFEVRDVKAGHWLISEKPAEFMELLQDWIERKEDV